jgi:predicted DNA-binding protein (MmcQ/YjbR family)
MVSEVEILELARGLGEVSEEVLTEDGGQGRKARRILKREGKIFLVIWEGTWPLRIEVKCDEKLGKLLREKYESVLDSKTLGRGGVEVICSGQLSQDEVGDLLRFSWNYCCS